MSVAFSLGEQVAFTQPLSLVRPRGPLQVRRLWLEDKRGYKELCLAQMASTTRRMM